jgi:hypothetical protein
MRQVSTANISAFAGEIENILKIAKEKAKNTAQNGTVMSDDMLKIHNRIVPYETATDMIPRSGEAVVAVLNDSRTKAYIVGR